MTTRCCIVLNYNGRAFLADCLTALLSQFSADELVVVDNASTDDSCAFLGHHFPHIHLLPLPHNGGFSAGNNAALQTISADFYFLVNPDVVIHPHWREAMEQGLSADPRIGIVGCKLYYPNGQLQHAGGFLTYPHLLPTHDGIGQADEGQWNSVKRCDYIIGAAMGIKGELLAKIGGFDERFFLYFEDTDLCRRAQQAGFEVVYLPEPTATHIESATTQKASFFYLRHFHTSRLRFAHKHGEEGVWSAEKSYFATCSPHEQTALFFAYRHHALTPQPHPLAASLYQYARQTLLASPALPANAPSLIPHRFTSPVPIIGRLIAGLRTQWNNVASKWYVDSVIQQQNGINQQLLSQLEQQAKKTDFLEHWLLAVDQELADNRRLHSAATPNPHAKSDNSDDDHQRDPQ